MRAATISGSVLPPLQTGPNLLWANIGGIFIRPLIAVRPGPREIPTQGAKIEDIDWGFVASSDDGLRLCAGLIDGKVYTSIDGGQSWIQRDPASRNRKWEAGASSSDGNKLTIVAQEEYLYTSEDGGEKLDKKGSSRFTSLLDRRSNFL